MYNHIGGYCFEIRPEICLWLRSDCEIPIDLRNLQFVVICRQLYRLRLARRKSGPRFRQTNPKMRKMLRLLLCDPTITA